MPSECQYIAFGHQIKERGSIKDAIEALGVPHPKIDLVLVNGESVGFSYLLKENDCVSIYLKTVDKPVIALSSH